MLCCRGLFKCLVMFAFCLLLKGILSVWLMYYVSIKVILSINK